jgi:hypothetical protein
VFGLSASAGGFSLSDVAAYELGSKMLRICNASTTPKTMPYGWRYRPQ